MAAHEKSYAYTTLITRANYLCGVLILAYTLKKQGSKYPLIVFYTPSLKQEAVKLLEQEAKDLNLILQPCELLMPASHVKVTLIAERFTDTWTKLRVFEAIDYDAVCYLDADMAIYKNMDSVFDKADSLPQDWIAANHACVCNLDRDPWAPKDWNVDNCAYTPLSHPEALSKPTQPTPDARGTYHILNSGMFLYHPSKQLWDDMLHFFNTTDKLSTYKFPDQDFLADFFRNRWQGLGWQYNALKTMRYIHPGMWRDDEVVCLHYIVDKPWVKRVKDGIAGFQKKDGVTHQWWWDEYEDWAKQRQDEGSGSTVQTLKDLGCIAADDGTESSDPDMLAIGNKVQAFANNQANENEKPAGDDQQAVSDGGTNFMKGGEAFKPKALGERGHGPRVRGKGSSKMPP